MRAQRSDPLRLAFALNESCRSLQQMSDFQRAENACREALAIRKSHLPPNAPEIGHTHEALGVVEQSRGDMSAAKNDYLSALDIFSNAGEAEREGLASAHHDLGFLASMKATTLWRCPNTATPTTSSAVVRRPIQHAQLAQHDRADRTGARRSRPRAHRFRKRAAPARAGSRRRKGMRWRIPKTISAALLQDQGDFAAAELGTIATPMRCTRNCRRIRSIWRRPRTTSAPCMKTAAISAPRLPCFANRWKSVREILAAARIARQSATQSRALPVRDGPAGPGSSVARRSARRAQAAQGRRRQIVRQRIARHRPGDCLW